MDRRVLLVLAWAACAVLAAGLGFAAASLVGDAIGDTPSASADTPGPVVTPTSPATPSGSSTPTTSSRPRTSRPSTGSARTTSAAPTVRTASRSTSGGLVVATCRAGLVKVSPSPAPGWRLDSWTTGSAPAADVEFRNGTSTVEVRVHCGSSGPLFSVETGTSGGGGGDDGGGSGGSGGNDSGGSSGGSTSGSSTSGGGSSGS